MHGYLLWNETAGHQNLITEYAVVILLPVGNDWFTQSVYGSVKFAPLDPGWFYENCLC